MRNKPAHRLTAASLSAIGVLALSLGAAYWLIREPPLRRQEPRESGGPAWGPAHGSQG